MNAMTKDQLPWTREEFEEKLREKGRGYHIYHPYHVMMLKCVSNGLCVLLTMTVWMAKMAKKQLAGLKPGFN